MLTTPARDESIRDDVDEIIPEIVSEIDSSDGVRPWSDRIDGRQFGDGDAHA